MIIKKIQDAEGAWEAPTGERFTLIMMRRIRNAQGINVGYEEFDSLECALKKWSLSRCICKKTEEGD